VVTVVTALLRAIPVLGVVEVAGLPVPTVAAAMERT
jgi:hypothetical protein